MDGVNGADSSDAANASDEGDGSIDPGLIDSIRQLMMANGIDPSQLRQKLLQAGLDPNTVDQLMNAIGPTGDLSDGAASDSSALDQGLMSASDAGGGGVSTGRVGGAVLQGGDGGAISQSGDSGAVSQSDDGGAVPTDVKGGAVSGGSDG